MRWVYDALPPRPRLRWLLMTVRLSTSNFAGTARTLVAVGTVRLASMFATTRDAAPRRGRRSPVVGGGAGCSAAAAAAAVGWAGAGRAAGAAGAGFSGAGAGGVAAFAVVVADPVAPLVAPGT